MYKKLTISIIGILLYQAVWSQTNTKGAQYVSDLNILVTSLRELHPTLYKNISETDFNAHVDSIKAKLLLTKSRFEAIYLMQSLVYRIADGHTYNSSVYGDLDVPRVLPFNVYILQDKLYIKYYYADTSYNGKEIISINKTPSRDLIDSLRIFFPQDGVGVSATSPYMQPLFNNLYAAFCHQTDTCEVLTSKGPLQAVTVKKGSFQGIKLSQNPLGSYYSQNMIFDKKVVQKEYGYFKWMAFFPKYNGDNIEKEYYSFIQLLNQWRVPNLILDLRSNTGGSATLAGRMGTYLSDKPYSLVEKRYMKPVSKPTHIKYILNSEIFYLKDYKTKKSNYGLLEVSDKEDYKKLSPHADKFNGKIYIIVDGGTFSASTMLCKYLLDQENVVFVGTETAGAINYFSAFRLCEIELPNIHTDFTFGLDLLELKKGSYKTEMPTRLQPDQKIEYTIDDLIHGRDKEMEWILGDIQSRKK